MLAAFLTTILISISVVCGHRSSKLIGGTEANFWRLAFATLFLGIWSYSFGCGLNGVALPIFLLSGVAGIGIGDVALFQALPRIGSRLSVLLVQCLAAPFGALIEWLWLGTTLSVWQILCGVTILAGVGIALAPSEHLKLTRRDLISGVLFSITAALGGALGAVLSRKAYAAVHLAGQHIDGANAGFQRILGGLFIAGICLLVVKRRTFKVQSRAPHEFAVKTSNTKWRGVWPWVLGNSLAGQTLGVSCMQWALETTPTGIVLAIIAMTPLVVIPFARVFEGEKITARAVAGGAIGVAGVVGLVLAK
jgi:drug/metabolite transporter (DMT)-like permease